MPSVDIFCAAFYGPFSTPGIVPFVWVKIGRHAYGMRMAYIIYHNDCTPDAIGVLITVCVECRVVVSVRTGVHHRDRVWAVGSTGSQKLPYRGYSRANQAHPWAVPTACLGHKTTFSHLKDCSRLGAGSRGYMFFGGGTPSPTFAGKA